jgi:predicted RNA-binding protein (virulence factor B family)
MIQLLDQLKEQLWSAYGEEMMCQAYAEQKHRIDGALSEPHFFTGTAPHPVCRNHRIFHESERIATNHCQILRWWGDYFYDRIWQIPR